MVTSSAAVGALTLPSSVQKSDPLLCLISSLASPLQLKVTTPKKGGSLELSLRENTIVLSQRNSILRSICGMAFHNALDSHPHYLMGGHSVSMSGNLASAAMGMSGISSWMSVAATIRDKTEDVGRLLGTLDGHLETRAFLVASAIPTLADYDLYFAIVSVMGDDVKTGRNVERWLDQVQHAALGLVELARENRPLTMANVTVDILDYGNASAMAPMFFYPDEDIPDLPPATPSSDSKKTAPSSTTQKQTATATTKAARPVITEEQKQAAAAKRAKKKSKKPKSTPAAPPPSAEVDISALDIRVGKILKVWNHETADKLYCEEVDVGEATPRKIASGLRPFYKLEDMQDANVLVLCNLKARNLVGFPSHGMVMCASNADHTKVEFVMAPEGAVVGEKVVFDGCEGKEPDAENRVAKKKIFEKLAPDLKTDGDGGVEWKGKKAMTSKGQCRAINKMAGASVS